MKRHVSISPTLATAPAMRVVRKGKAMIDGSYLILNGCVVPYANYNIF
jgi:hypothetical protein